MASNSSPSPLKARLISYYEPCLLIVLSLFFLVKTLLTSPHKAIFAPKEFRNLWFQNLWKIIGPKMATVPYQEPYISKLLGRAKGTVLEFGPGTGDRKWGRSSVLSFTIGKSPC